MTTNHSSTIYGTGGGTLLSIFGNLQTGDVFKTIFLAIIGAITSFILSVGLNWIHRKLATKSTKGT